MYKRSKYNAVKVTIDGIKFDSKKEGRRYQDLKMLEKAGEISGLILQPSFELLPKIKWNTKTLRKRTYKADFMYYDFDKCGTVVEDVKGFLTDVYLIKRQMFLIKYPQYIFIET